MPHAPTHIRHHTSRIRVPAAVGKTDKCVHWSFLSGNRPFPSPDELVVDRMSYLEVIQLEWMGRPPATRGEAV